MARAVGTHNNMKCLVPAGVDHARSRVSVTILLLLGVALALPTPLLAAPKGPVNEAWPASVKAVYRINFGIFGDIGSYRFKSRLKDGKYNLDGVVKIETTVLDYSAVMRSSGSFVSAEPSPDSHMFRFKQAPVIGKKKRSTLHMEFDDSGVKHVKFVPKKKSSKRSVPVTEQQLENVLDPLSAIMALSLDQTGDPCWRTLSVFDGKHRFDLIFTLKRQSSRKLVCGVRFVPISGHRKGEGNSVIIGNAEVVLRRVPKANIVIPSRVTVPTIAGDAVLESEKVIITMPDRKRIAFRR